MAVYSTTRFQPKSPRPTDVRSSHLTLRRSVAESQPSSESNLRPTSGNTRALVVRWITTISWPRSQRATRYTHCCVGLLCLLGLGTQVLRSYDLVAVRPATGALFAKCCTALEIDIISLDMSAKLPFHLRPQLVRLSSRPGPGKEPVCRWPRQLPEVWCLSCVTRSCSRTSHLEGGR